MKPEFSIPSLAARIATEADAYKLLEERWPGGQPDSCPQWGADGKFYFLTPKDGGEVRKTRTGQDTARRLWECATCRKKFSVLTGTVFRGSKIPVRTWLFVTLEPSASKNGVSAREIERKYGLTPKTAWFMLHRLREAMKRDDTAPLMSGTLVADETWIGGDPGNQHSRAKLALGPDRWTTRKTTILSVIDKATGEARSAVVPNVRASTPEGDGARVRDQPGRVHPAHRLRHLLPAHRRHYQRPRVRQPRRRGLRARRGQHQHG
jgi:transposase-like protein